MVHLMNEAQFISTVVDYFRSRSTIKLASKERVIQCSLMAYRRCEMSTAIIINKSIAQCPVVVKKNKSDIEGRPGGALS